MINDNKFIETSLEELHKLRGELAEKENHLQILNTWYNNERDDRSRKGILKDIKSVELKIKEIKNKMTDIKNKAHLKDSMDMLKLMGWTTDSCGEKVYTKGESTEDECKDGGPGSGIKGHTGGEPMARLSKKWTTENINHILRNPHLYREEVVEEAARKALENKSLLKKAEDDDPDIQYKEFMANKKKPLTYSEGKKLLEEAKKAGIHQDYLKGMERGLASLKDDAGDRLISPSYTDTQLEKMTSEELEYIINKPKEYTYLTRSDAKKILEKRHQNLKDDDATEMGSFEQLGQNHETEAMEPEEHPVLAQDGSFSTVADVRYEKSNGDTKWVVRMSHDGRFVGLEIQQGKIKLPATYFDSLEDGKRWVDSQMKTSMLQRAKGQKDSMISEVLNPLKESWSKIKELSTEDAIPTDWDVGLFDGKWYITRNGRKVKGPFSSMKAAENYLENSKMYLEDVSTKDASWRVESTQGTVDYKLYNYKEGKYDIDVGQAEPGEWDWTVWEGTGVWDTGSARSLAAAKSQALASLAEAKRRSAKDSDPKVAEANKLISLFGGVK